jgi:hypothetical protein
MTRGLVLALLLVPVWAAAEPLASPYLYLNRCRGGCVVYGGFDDARTMSSSIPCSGTVTCGGGGCMCSGGTTSTYMIEEFKDSQGNIGDAATPEWNAVMQCLREVYSPYNVMVIDQLPAGGISHNQGIVAGRPVNIGYGGAGIGGIAPGSTECAPRDNVISFTFANIYSGSDRVHAICAVAAQETAHAYGLDHEYEFSDHRSACNDPMSYRSDCGGQKFFRNENASCGEFAARTCRCGGFQNSHLRILSVFGPGTVITSPPVITLSAPADGAMVTGSAVITTTASSQRGIAHVDLWLNGYKWASVKGAAFGSAGQPESVYSLVIPSEVPDSIIDVVVKAYDDLEIETDTPQITITKGAACASASTCLKGQQCSEGRCAWPPPTGELGTYKQFCKSGSCVDSTDGMFCSQPCVVGVADSCPVGYLCDGPDGSTGFCIGEHTDSGCCNASSDGRMPILLALGVLAVALRSRRKL